MNRYLSMIVLFCLFGTPVQAQTSMDPDGSDMLTPHFSENPVIDKKFLVLAAMQHGAMIIDGISTFNALDRCKTCVETNPVAKPFIKAGRMPAYLAGALAQTGESWLMAKMRKHKNPAIRAIWWVPPVALTYVHLQCIRNNMRN